MRTILHAADIHLGAPLRGLPRRPGAAQPPDAVRAAFTRLIDAACAGRVDLLVIAGDLFDRDMVDLRDRFFAQAQLERATRAGVRVALIFGNHDAEARAAADGAWPEGVTALGASEPGRVVYEDIGVAVTGQSFGARAETRNLAAAYPPPAPGRFNLALLHTSCDGRDGHAPYAPCAPADLAASGYDYWALGHAHAFEIVNETPWIVYSGALQGLSPRETGPHGAARVEIGRDGAAKVAADPFDVARWETARVDAAGVEDEAALGERLREALRTASARADGRFVAARVEFHGETPLDGRLRGLGAERWVEAAAEAAEAVGGDRAAGLAISGVRFRTRPPLTDGRVDQGLLDEVRAAARDADVVSELEAALEAALRRAGSAAPALPLEACLEEAVALIVGELASEGLDDAADGAEAAIDDALAQVARRGRRSSAVDDAA